MTPLPEDTLTKLKEYVSLIKPLDENIPYKLVYLETNDVKNILPIKAPYYICIYSQKKGNYLMNAGFLLQQIDLYLSASNIASCWLGMAKPSKQVPQLKDDLEFVIMLAFGNTMETLHRVETSQFKRKSMSAISNIVADKLLEPARLAPSASNTQPWFFSGSPDLITVSREKLNLIKAPLYGKFNQIDIGIALCHLWISIEHHGKVASYDFKKTETPNGYEFMVKVRIGDK
jgi:Nitroreductase